MFYKNIAAGKFISRPNRFIANVEIDGEIQVVHVKNTGRCKELLLPGSTVYCEKSDNPNRKTAYDLVAVEKGKLLINMDSQAPNVAFSEFIHDGSFKDGIEYIARERKYKNSRFDFYFKRKGKEYFAEVKGVTLEDEGVVLFPDAPTERGVKHLTELEDAVKNGYGGCVVFVVQLKEAKYFTPNRKTHPEFADKLKEVQKAGVEIFAYTCNVTPNSISLLSQIPVVI